MALTMCYLIVVILESFLLCRPFAYNWDKTIEGSCANQTSIFLSAGVINLLIDVMIVTLPMPMLWRLRMPLGRKIALSGVFGMGAL